MFGLEKGKKSLFEFDLEKDLKKNPKKAKEILDTVGSRVQAIKTTLRTGAESKDFEKMGLLLQGYTSLQRVLSRINNKQS